MTNDNITPDDWRKAADALDTLDDRFPWTLGDTITFCRDEADRLDAAQARDTEAETLARIMHGCHGRVQDWETSIVKADYLREARAALDHLASRLAPDNGITLTADEVEDLREVLRWCGRRNNPGAEQEFCVNQAARLRARFAPTEQTETKLPEVHLNEAGRWVSNDFPAWYSNAEWSPEFDEGRAETVSAEFRPFYLAVAAAKRSLHAAEQAETTRNNFPNNSPEQAEPGEWKRWQDVPDGVVYWPKAKQDRLCKRVNRDGLRHLVNSDGTEQLARGSEESVRDLAPFVRVDAPEGGAL